VIRERRNVAVAGPYSRGTLGAGASFPSLLGGALGGRLRLLVAGCKDTAFHTAPRASVWSLGLAVVDASVSPHAMHSANLTLSALGEAASKVWEPGE
jgi:hypothetical protein